MMEIDAPNLSSESDGDEALFQQLCKEEYEEHGWQATSDDESCSSSSSSSSSEEAEAQECYDSRLFIERLSFNPCVSVYEAQNLVSAPRVTKRRKREQHLQEPVALVIAKGEDRISDDDRKRTAFRVEVGDKHIDIVVENYVYSSYFCNRHTGAPYPLGLCELAIKMLPYGVQYSKNKFTKVTLKYLNGPSHYFFGSGVLVESGTYGNAIAYKCHHNSMRILKETCRYESVCVKKRRCQNIVAKGTLPFGVCIELLKHRYPNYVQYDKTRFAGAIIRLGEIDASHNLRLNEGDDSLSSFSSDDDDHSDEEDDDDTNSSVLSGSSSSSSSSSSSYEYYERMPYEEKTCHEEFDYKVLVDRETRNRNKALLKKKQDQGEYRVLEKKPLRHKDMVQLHNPDELNDYQVDALTQKKNETILVFSGGRIICAGCRSDAAVCKSFDKVMPMLENCADNEHNRAAEAEHIKRQEQQEQLLLL